jgi:hypothetical protein
MIKTLFFGKAKNFMKESISTRYANFTTQNKSGTSKTTTTKTRDLPFYKYSSTKLTKASILPNRKHPLDRRETNRKKNRP